MVAELLGTKLFLNEFVAYQELAQYKQRRLAGAEEWIGTKKQWISVSVRAPPCGGGMMPLLPGPGQQLSRLLDRQRTPGGGAQPPSPSALSDKIALGFAASFPKPLRRLLPCVGAGFSHPDC